MQRREEKGAQQRSDGFTTSAEKLLFLATCENFLYGLSLPVAD
jgi:hypothetical protein